MTSALRPTRVMGIETEYGISVAGPSEDALHPMQLSNHVVKGYAALAHGNSADWDYETESPLRDQRGYDLDRGRAHPDQLTDADLGMANVILTNGARLYVDHAHPEYSGPEVTTARDAVLYDRAGDVVMAMAAKAASRQLGREVRLYKNNTDGKGASYGTHENYLVDRATPFDRIVTQFTPFLVSRIPVVGAGRVGLGQASEKPGFQISQRADFFEAEVGLETTMNRPIINTRDEPHADATRHRRLHVITGDATSAEVSTWLKVGTAALVLRVIESGALAGQVSELRLARPVAAMQVISHDPTCTATVDLADGRRVRATDLQEHYLAAVREHLEQHGETFTEVELADAKQLVERWQQVLDQLRVDPLGLAGQLDWVAKYQLLGSYRRRDSLEWNDPKLALVDLQYAEVDPTRSLYHKLVRAGRMERLLDDADIERARTTPPSDTRAWFRGECMRKYPSEIVAASWDSLILDVPGRRALQRLPLLDPLRGTRDQVGELLDGAPDVAALLAALGR